MTCISKEFRFSASHRLTQLPETHKCHRLHGHNYTVTLRLEGDIDPATGMVLDYGVLKKFGAFLDTELDHRHLGSGHVYDAQGRLTDRAVLGEYPTAENLAVWLLGVAKAMFGGLVLCVRVAETENTDAVAFNEDHRVTA